MCIDTDHEADDVPKKPAQAMRSLAELQKQFQQRRQSSASTPGISATQRPNAESHSEVDALVITVEELERTFQKTQQPDAVLQEPRRHVTTLEELEEELTKETKQQVQVESKRPPMPPGRIRHGLADSKASSAEALAQELYTGTIKKLMEGKGFGFVQPHDTCSSIGDVFLHFSDISPAMRNREVDVGTHVRFRVEILDGRNGCNRRARDVSIEEAQAEADSRSDSYNREVLLVARNHILKLSRNRGRNGNRNGVATGVGITSIFIPRAPEESRQSAREDPKLDDEALLKALEARLDRELGFDAKNHETFGDDWLEAGGHWSYEEAVAANTLLNGGTEKDCADLFCQGISMDQLVAFADAKSFRVMRAAKEIEFCTSTALPSPRSRASSTWTPVQSCIEDKFAADEMEELYLPAPICFQ